MATIFSNFQFDQRVFSLNLIYSGAFDSELQDNVNETYNGINYTDLFVIDWTNSGTDFASVFGGDDLAINADSELYSGAVTGYLELFWNGSEDEDIWGIQDISISAAELYESAKTTNTSDEIQLLNMALSGADTFSLSSSDDFANGLGGDDKLYGFAGNDILKGGSGDDVLKGGSGIDTLKGGGGSDTLKGGGGSDTLKGGGGSDTLKGGGGSDTLKGGNGSDTLYGNKGNDDLYGGGGEDNFIFSKGDGSDTIYNFNVNDDVITIRNGANDFSDLSISQKGNDVDIAFNNVSITLDDFDIADVEPSLFIF